MKLDLVILVVFFVLFILLLAGIGTMIRKRQYEKAKKEGNEEEFHRKENSARIGLLCAYILFEIFHLITGKGPSLIGIFL